MCLSSHISLRFLAVCKVHPVGANVQGYWHTPEIFGTLVGLGISSRVFEGKGGDLLDLKAMLLYLSEAEVLMRGGKLE
jgi:hypothetical protein